MRKYRTSQKIWAVVLTLVMVLGMIPPTTVTAVGADYLNRTADPGTMNDYQELFLNPDTIGVELTTENAGGIWTDKSVFSAGEVPAELTGATSQENTQISVTDTGDNFLVALSAVASNKEIVGYSTRPTDTVLVLDLSGSMKGSTSAMVSAANKAIGDLLALNELNRVGVVLYSGNSQTGNSNTSTATVLLPLGRYTTTSYTGYGANRAPQYIRSNNEQVSVPNGVSPRTDLGSAKNTVGGTYTQNGIYKAMNQLVNADEKVIPEGSLQAGTTRLPIMVLMTDGEPSAATKNYTNIGTSDVGNGETGTSIANDMAFLTQLTMAYAKREIDTAYKTDSLVYTLGYSVDNNNYARSVMDPAAYTTDRIDTLWNTFNNTAAGKTFQIQARQGQGTTVTKHTDAAGKYAKELKDYRYYTDRYFPAARQSDLTAAFQSIVDEIILQAKYYPTFVEKDHDHDGYITFTDKIGPYMDVTEVHGIVIGDTLFSGALLARGFGDGSNFGTVDNPSQPGNDLVWSVQERLGISDVSIARQLLQNAYTYGQLSYTSDTQFSNYIGWYSDANGNYLDFWYEGITTAAPAGATHVIKSYIMLGETDEAHGISAEDMMYASVRVSKELEDFDNDGIAGESMVTWRIPASLVPTITYQVQVETNAANEITSVTDLKLENANVKPIRLLYEVALRDTITEWNISETVLDGYRDSTANKDAGYVFYSNQWKKENGTTDTTRNTYSHFEPSVQNEWYYYTEDAIIYTDENGTQYTGSSAPGTSGTYYRAYQVYEKLETGAFRVHTHYEQISAESLAKAKQSGSNWVIPKGTVFRFWDPFQETKSANNTDTHAYSEYPSIVYDESAGHYYAYEVLGNNGKLTVTPATGIKVTKTVEEVVAGASDTFTFVISGGSGTATLIRLDENGNEATRSTLTFADGKAEFTLTADETVYIIGLTDGTAYTIQEKGNEHYSVSAVTVNGAAVTGSVAQITATSQNIQSAAFVNSPKGYGDLFITKEIVSEHTVPASIQSQSFDVTVNVGADLAGQTFTVNATDMVSGGVIATTETVAEDGTISLTIVHGQTYQIVDLPEGVQVTVTEALTDAQKVYFTGTVKTRDYTGAEQDADNLVTIHKDANSTAVLTNTYAPASGDLTIDFAGIKNFDAEKMTEDAEFTFRLQQYVNGTWVDVDTASVTIPAGKKDASENFNFDSLELTFTKEGTYSCQILEDIGVNTDVTYDRSVYTFTVVVTDNDGQLEAKVVANVESGDEGNFSVTQGTDGDWTVSTVFNNEYHTAPTDIDIKKTVVDNAGSGKTNQGFVMESYNASVDGDGVWTEGSLIRSAVTDALGEARLDRNYDNSDFAEGENTKTYHFIIKEKNTGITGWTYDATHYLVTVELTRTVEAGGTDSITANITIHKGIPGENHTFTAGEEVVASGNAATISFTNTYDPVDAQVDLTVAATVAKKLEGRALKAGEFTFAVFEDGKASHTDTTGALAVGTNDANGNVAFDKPLKFSQVGTYHFDVVEITGALGGVSYDNTVYDMVVEVKDVDGVLDATYYFEDSVTSQVTFTNEYQAAETDIVIDGTKTLTGRPLVNAEFQFTLVEVADETGAAEKAGGVKLTAHSDPDNDNDGTTQFAFDDISYTEPGTYYYLIQEVNAGSTILGVTHSTAKYVVKVTVSDPGDGQLVASSEVVGGGNVAFTNVYVPQPTHTNLQSSKQLTGRVMKDGEFSFTLTEKTDDTYATDKTGGVSETVNNDADGNIIFSTLHFNEAGDYYYVIEEAKGSAGGVTYDDTKYHIHIQVVDNHKGSLVATTHITKVTAEGSQQVETISFYNTYTIDGDGELTLKGTKVLEGKTLEAGDFSFGLYDGEGNLIESVKNDEAGNFLFTKLQYTEADVGNTYVYQIREILPVVGGVEMSKHMGITYDTAVYTVEVMITDDGEGGITVSHTVNGAATPVVFTNKYAVEGYDTVVLGGTKHVTGDRTAITAGEYEFGLYEGGTQLQKVAVKADGTFAFQELSYEVKDIRPEPYEYTIKEIVPADTKGVTYDTKEYKVLVYVTDNGEGGVEASYTIDGSAYTQVVFTNTYTHKSVDYVLEAKKTYTKPLKGDDFTFTLSGEGYETQTKKNDADGKVVFDKLTFTDDGIYTFTVTEVDKLLGFISYSKEVYTVKITVRDNGIGQLVVTDVAVTDSEGKAATELLFENVYVLDGEAQVTLHGTKTLSGFRTQLQDKEFAFGLYDSQGNLLQTAYNDTLGNFMFSTLVFDETYVGQTLTYTVKEILPVVDGEEVTEHEGRIYDTAVYTVVILVKDNQQGGVVIDYTINGAVGTPIAFSNRYEVEPAVVQLEGVKSYNRPLKGNDFTFTLTGEGQNQQKKNDADGKIVFDEIVLTKEGTYYYEIAEVKEALGFITYSDKINKVQVVVTDNNKGQLEAVVTINDETDGQIAFENIYNLTGEAEIVLEAIKHYNQTLEAGDFSFTLTGEDQNQLKTNDAAGKVVFDKLTFGVEDLGVHTYYVEEVLPKDEHGHEVSSFEGISYDTHTYTVVVTVFDNGTGKVEATYTVDGVDEKAMIFTNTYTVDGHDTVDLSGTKVMTGERDTVAAGEFTFGLYYPDGTKVLDSTGNHITATNDAAGNFAFPTLYYNETHIGVHKYLVKEIVPDTNPSDGITYDTTVYQVEIHVVDNQQGTVDASYTVNGSAHGQILFTNTYAHEPTTHKLQAKKVYEKGLKGGDFTFTLTGEGFESQTKKNDAEGNVYFDELTFTDNGVYTFTVTETDKILGFIDYSTEVYTVKVTVTDNGKGKLFVEKVEVTDSQGKTATDMIFVNVYEITGTDQIVLSGTKTITGDRTAVKDKEFTFELYGSDGTLVQSVKNDASGNFAFTALSFDKDDIGKDITYTVKEKTETAGGMTYDDTVYTVKVTVADDNLGGVTANYEILGAEAIAFTNQYVANDVKVKLEATKIYDKPLKGDDFTFVLKNDQGKVLQTKKNDAEGKVIFDELIFEEVGEYTYTVEETDKLLGFIQYSSASYQVVITVTDPGDGQLVASVAVTGGAENGKMEFVNTYILDGEDYVDLYVQKVFNLPLHGDEFKFGLYNDQGELLQIAANMADGKAIFGTLTYDEKDVGKTFTYTVAEILPVVDGHEVNVHYGITYDTTVYTVEVTVSDNGVGGVDAVYTVNGGNQPMVFTNNYSVSGNDNLHLEGIKEITGERTQLLEGETYTFELIDSDGNVVETAASDAAGKFVFTDIHFEADDIRTEPYLYTVKEQIPSGDKKGVSYDTTVYEVEVYVMDNGVGGVEVAYNINNHGHDHLIFTNTYTAADATVDLKATKTYEKGLKGDDFTFTLDGEIDGVKIQQEKKNDADGNIFFDTLTFTQEDTYTFRVVETDKILGFIQYSDAEYEIVITVTDNENGELEAEVLVNTVKDGKIEFVNEYKYIDAEDEVTITGTKALTGFRTQTKAGEFSFGLYKGDQLVEQVTNTADGSFAFTTLTYDQDDVGTHTYTVKEIIPEGAVENKLNGYTYDATVYTVTVEVVDDNKGNIVATAAITGVEEIVFTNKYEVKDVEVNLKGTKTYDKPLAGDDFTFALEGEIDGVKVKQEKKNDKNGTITFDTLKFTKEGTYQFSVKELDEALGFIQYAKEVYKVQITVTDNGKGALVAAVTVNDKADGKMEFVNDYTLTDDDNELTLTGTKALVGRDLTAGEFTFGLYEGETLLETVTNDASGNFTFTKLVYQIQEGQSVQHTYTVKEIAGSDPSVTYDKTVYTVVVNVADDNKGGTQLTYTVNGADKGEITFTNVYTKPEDVTAKILVQKTVINKTEPGIGLKDFTFILSNGSSTVEAKSDENGKAGFQITFGAADIGKTYEFQVSEKKGSTAGMTYDNTVHTVIVKVGQNADGSLALTINGQQTDTVSLGFTNTYEKPGTPVTGDSFPVIFLGVVTLLSLAAVVLLLGKGKKTGKYAA